jgi:hypothetical protein
MDMMLARNVAISLQKDTRISNILEKPDPCFTATDDIHICGL